MSSVILGLGVFTLFLAFTSYHEQVWSFLVQVLHPIVPYQSWVGYLIFLILLIVVYFAYRVNRSEKQMTEVYIHPTYRSVEEFEFQKKRQTNEAVKRLIDSAEYKQFELKKRLGIDRTANKRNYDYVQTEKELRQKEEELFDS